MKNFVMKVLALLEMKDCSYSSVLSHYDLDMYLWY